jgi:two-component system nitrogen regulation sensor histidine kinase GlnL
VSSVSATVGTPLALTTSGGSGNGAVTYTVTNGTATDCAESGGVLTATGFGTCIVTATKGSDSTYLPISSETVEVSVTSIALTNKPWAALLEIKDIEQRVLVDRSIRLVDDIETQHELLRNLAHEVKNPLGGLRGAAQLLESELPDPALQEYTRVIISEADRLQALVDRLAAPQRMPIQWQSVNIHEVCERVCALVRAEFRDVALVRDYDASMPEFRADPARLVQALLNVVRNAAQMLTGSIPVASPLITLKTRVARQVLLRHKQHKMAIVVSVTDNGPGVPLNLQDRIFHPLVTGREGGTGLGLSLAQDFVQQHGGVIEFDSRPGHTEFRLMLPMESL